MRIVKSNDYAAPAARGVSHTVRRAAGGRGGGAAAAAGRNTRETRDAPPNYAL